MFKLLLFLGLVLFGVNSSPQQRRVTERYGQESQNLHFVLSARNLPSQDANYGKADPFVKVYYGAVLPYGNRRGSDLDRLGDSEVIINEENPTWLKVFKVQYNKGTYQKLWVEVRDHDSVNPDDIIGNAFIDMDEYVEHGHQLTVPLKGTKSGSITIQNTAPFLFTLAVKSVPALDDFGGYSDPYVTCYFRYSKEGRDHKFYETNSVSNTETASWEQPITFDNFQRGTNQMFHFVVKDHDSISADDLVGEAFMEVDAFADKKMQSVLPLSSSHNATLFVKYVL